jgi:hypothetical protein
MFSGACPPPKIYILEPINHFSLGFVLALSLDSTLRQCSVITKIENSMEDARNYEMERSAIWWHFFELKPTHLQSSVEVKNM